MISLDNKIALVTGAASNGIGRAVAVALAHAGADVAIHHHMQHQLADELAADLGSVGRRTMTLNADLGDPAQARKLVHDVTDHFDSLDICVACAATLDRVPLVDITDEQWNRVHDINLRGYFAVSQEAARHMVTHQSGRIIMISSINQTHATPNLAHYVSSKGGVMMLARAMALELANQGITVNLVAPGTILTDLNRENFADEEFKRQKLSLIPMERLGMPDDVAGAVLYLASDEASYITGTTITVDGGLTLV